MKISALSTPSRDSLAALDDTALQACLRAQVDAAMRVCRDVYPELPEPRVWFDLRGKSAGQAHFGRGGLRFNLTLYRDNRYTFLAEIVPHEVAHWLVHHLDEGPYVRPHGHEWQTVMRDLFGLQPRTTHNFDVSAASPAPYRYRCGCRDHFFTARRHALARRGNRYYCRQCSQELTHEASRGVQTGA
ncbi:SprT family zinc-dependent metalloprotease [Aidingimonas lacisalsi]|uniref:SprT family zinc-dependent metalloprotease n=1 Tax=Aidingimonas lacisalsi TaxID=2604086 RepID=UPI0011D2BDF9|nr:SprT-like domain-containing protein [Aidingimonas lacisalsi]